MKKIFFLIAICTTSLTYANPEYEAIAKDSWHKTFKDSSCVRELASSCVKNRVAVVCETYPVPYSGDGDCYEALEVLTFLPPEGSSTGEVEVLGKAQPTW